MNSLVASNPSAALINAVGVGSGSGCRTIWPGADQRVHPVRPAHRRSGRAGDREPAQRLGPSFAPYFNSAAAGLAADITGRAGKLADIRKQYAGTPTALADPVARYLTEAAGLVDRAPPRTRCRHRQGRNVPDAVLADTLAVINADQVVAVIFNSHSTAPVIDQIVGAAAARDIPVAGISATLPAGKDYLGWVDDAIANLADAVAA